jgi:hypothetical protein
VNASTLTFADRNIDLNVRNLGTINLQAGVSFNGLFTNEGDLRINADTAIDNLGFISGSISGPGHLTNGGEFFWSGGEFSGLGSLTTTGVTILDSESTKSLSSTTWFNSGTVDILGGNLFLCEANITNQVGGTMNFLASNFRIETESRTESRTESFINAGTLNFDSFGNDAAVTNGESGFITIAGLNTIDAVFDNRGSVNINSGFLDISNGSSVDGGDTGAYNIATGASLDFSGGTREWNTGVSFSRSGSLQINGVVNNNGAVNLSRDIGGEGTINNNTSGVITANGVDRTDTFNPLLNNFGTLDISGSDSYTLALMNSPSNNGIVNIAESNTLRLNADYTNNGVLTGKGKIDVGDFFGQDESLVPNTLINNGILRPGASPGTMEIVGNLDLTPSSVLDIELGGTSPGLFDVLTVSGNANLAGTLNTLPFGGFMPNNGDDFGFLSAPTLNGTFSTVNSPAAFLSSLTYGPNAITLTALLNGVEPPLVRPPTPPIDSSLLTTLDFSDLPNTGTDGFAAANFNALLQFAPSALIGDGSGSELYLGDPLTGDLRDARLLCN